MTVAEKNPAQSVLGCGMTQIWYMRPEHFRDGISGAKGPDPACLNKTHRMVARVGVTDKEEIFTAMQGERWSPNGEAREWIRQLGLQHTSMSVGDVVRLVGGKTFVCGATGWHRIDD